MARFGIVADTHGYFDPQLVELFAGCELILHAGDIGESVLQQLEKLAPTRAVKGNNDTQPWAEALPAARVERLAGVAVLVVHQVGSPDAPDLKTQFLLQAEKPRVVVYGHSHRAALTESGSVLFFNPGAAGKKRFKLIRSAGLFEVTGESLTATVFSLEDSKLGRIAQWSGSTG